MKTLQKIQENAVHNAKVVNIKGQHFAGNIKDIQRDIELGTEDAHHLFKMYAIEYPMFDAELSFCADIVEALGEFMSSFFNC